MKLSLKFHSYFFPTKIMVEPILGQKEEVMMRHVVQFGDCGMTQVPHTDSIEGQP